VTRVFADDHDTAVATNHLALVTDLLNAWSNFHFTPGRMLRPLCAPARPETSAPDTGGLLVAIGDTTTLQVVRGELHLDTISREDADVMHAHLAADVREDLRPVLQLHAEHGIGERFGDGALEDNRVFLGLRDGETSCKRGSRMLTR
jgi:hypothetical protein